MATTWKPSATKPNLRARCAAKAMNTLKSRDVYVDRMHRVIEHIDQHLDQFLDLETLAEVAHFSPFHFHRLFSAWMGETLGENDTGRSLRRSSLQGYCRRDW